MYRASVAVLLLWLGSLASQAGRGSQSARPAPASASGLPVTVAALPPGPMEAKARTACMECHDSSILVQQRLSPAAWTKEVDKMAKWGALVEPQDRQALIDYFSSHFSPEKPPYAPPLSATGGKRRPSSR